MKSPAVRIIEEALENCTNNGHKFPTEAEDLVAELREHGVLDYEGGSYSHTMWVGVAKKVLEK